MAQDETPLTEEARRAMVEDVLLMYRTAMAVRIPGRTNGIQITQDKHGQILRVVRTIGIRHRTVFNAAGMRVGETEVTAKIQLSAILHGPMIGVSTFLRSAAWRAEGWVPAIPAEEEARLRAEIVAIWAELDVHEADARRLHEENRQAKLAGKGAEERIRKGTAQLLKAVKGTAGVDGLTSDGMARVLRIHAVHGCFVQTGDGSVQFDTKRMQEVELEAIRDGSSLHELLRQAHLWAGATKRSFGMGTFLQYANQNPLIAGLLNRDHVEEARKLSLVEDVMEA